MKAFVLTSLLLFAISSIQPALSQSSDFKQQNCNCSCFRGKPLGECKSFWVVETGFMSFAGESSADRNGYYDNMFNANLGKMRNISTRSALGGTINISTANDGMDIGIGPRYRHWISPRLAFDFSPRWIFARTGSYDLDGTGYQIDASVSIGELFSIDTHYRQVKYNPDYLIMPLSGYTGYFNNNPESKGFYFGLSGRSYAAPVAPALILLVHLIIKDSQSDQIDFRF